MEKGKAHTHYNVKHFNQLRSEEKLLGWLLILLHVKNPCTNLASCTTMAFPSAHSAAEMLLSSAIDIAIKKTQWSTPIHFVISCRKETVRCHKN